MKEPVSTSAQVKELLPALCESLGSDPKVVIDSARNGDVTALSAIFVQKDILPSELFPDIFLVCRKQLDANTWAGGKFLEALSHPDTVEASQKMALGAMMATQILGSLTMRLNIHRFKNRFDPLLIKHWQEMFMSLQILQIVVGPKDPSDHNSFGRATMFAEALVSLLSSNALLAHVRRDPELQTFAWKIWLLCGGGPETYGPPEVNYSSAATVNSWLYQGVMDKNVVWANLTDVCKEFGGVSYVAEVTLRSLCRTMQATEHLHDLKHHIQILFILAGGDPNGAFAQKLCELDGVAKLIEGVTSIAKEPEVQRGSTATSVGVLIELICQLTTENYKRFEQAASPGLLQMAAAFDLAESDPDAPLPIAIALLSFLSVIPQFFSSYSVVKALSKQMRMLTEGEHPQDRQISEGHLDACWKLLKVRLVERYIMMRLFDTFIRPGHLVNNAGARLDYCTNCAKTGEREKLLACASCKCTLYCSKECQKEDWKAGRHRESCSRGADGRYKDDIPFLCFLANKNVRNGYEEMVKTTKLSKGKAHFWSDVTLPDCEDAVGIVRRDEVEPWLQEKQSSSKETFRVIDRGSPLRGERSNSDSVVLVLEFEGLIRRVVRFIPLDLTPGLLDFGLDRNQPGRGFIDIFISKIDFPKGPLHRWTHVLDDGTVVHIFDQIDAFLRSLSPNGTTVA